MRKASPRPWALGARNIAVLLAVLLTSQELRAQVASSPALVADGNGEGFDTHLFRPAIDSKGFFSINGSDILGAGNLNLGLVLDYGQNLLRTRAPGVPTGADDKLCADPNCQPLTEGSGVKALIRDSYQGTFNISYGIANRAVVGVSAPVVLMLGDQTFQIGPSNNRYNTAGLDAEKLSTIALHGKLRLTRVDQGIGIAVSAQAGVPIGTAPKVGGADPGAWYWPQVIIENQFGSRRRFRVGLNVGYRGHTGDNPKFETDTTGQTQLKEGVFQYGDLATFGLGLSYRISEPLDLVAETYGSYLTSGISAEAQKHSQEFVGGAKVFVEHNSYLMLGAGSRIFTTGFQAADLRLILGFVYEPSIGDRDGDGYKDDVDQCPDNPEDFDGFQDADGCPDPDNDNDGILDVDDRCPNIPEDHDGDQDEDGCPEIKPDGDRDGDGILDSKDKCPDDPEDRDGFQDEDGCPEPDNDNDGIPDKQDTCPLDAEDRDHFEDEDGCPDPDNDKDLIPDVRDKCPNDPETYNGFEDEDGCPDKGKVVIEGNDIIILEKIHFETASAKILPESEEIIDAVAAALKGHPEFLIVDVGGHADERASDEYNLRLTKARVASVVEALKLRNIAGSRLVHQGYGEFCPLDDGHNEAAWEKNRRVEFKVVKTEDGLTDVERGCERAAKRGILPPKVE